MLTALCQRNHMIKVPVIWINYKSADTTDASIAPENYATENSLYELPFFHRPSIGVPRRDLLRMGTFPAEY